jgi:carbohydrate-selective porin OprB
LHWNFGKNSQRLPGNLKVGGYYNGGSASVFAAAPPLSPRNRAAPVFTSWRIEALFGALGRLHARPPFRCFWGLPGCAPDQRVNKVPYFFDTGMVLYGPSSKRPRDFFGLGLVYGSYSHDLRLAQEINPTPLGVQHFEMTVELNYGWTVRPGLLLQPDSNTWYTQTAARDCITLWQ